MLACPLFPRVRKLNRAVATQAPTSLADVEDVLIRSSLFLGGLWPPLVVLILDVQLISFKPLPVCSKSFEETSFISMAVAAYAKAIFGALVLEGLRAGVWTGVNRGADSWAPAERPLPALEDTSSPAQFSECPVRSIAQWQCPPCPECPACPDAQYVVSPAHSLWGAALASVSQLTLGFLAATCQYGCGRWGLMSLGA